MFLKKIEISGFKSFARRTVLDFSSAGVFRSGKNIGITTIVGPNGSGKSNVADALRWVLGEQSMKNLRGKKSEDVIFAGSGKKAKLGSAQVSIVLDNSDKKVPIEYEEVVITRKVFRSGEGEYLINGSRVRLIDVVDLLAKAGVGQRSYCIINQGMADQVLNASPLERRSIIEEAAGVKEYQVKKERSERKLRSTQNNLERVKGLLMEIEPHLRILKRQSQKAQKGEEYRQKLKEKQNQLFGYLWKQLQSSKDDFESDLSGLSREVMMLQREVDDLKEKLQKESTKTVDMRDDIAELEKKERQLSFELSDLERKLVVEEGRLELEKERQKGLRLIEVIPVGTELVKKSLMEIKNRQDNLIARLSQIKSVEELTELKVHAQDISKEIYQLYEGVIKGKIEKNKPEQEITRQKEVNLKRINEMMEQAKEIRTKLEKKDKEHKKTKQQIEELIQKDRNNRKEAIRLEDELRRKQFDLDKAKDKHNESKIEHAKIEIREEDLINRINQELKVAPEKIDYDNTEVSVSKWEENISRLKVLFEQSGAVDETILEEYDETQKRYDFLKNESDDLREAILSLKKVIKELEENIKGKFDETYKSINKSFNEYFKIIFNGGKSELKKVEVRTRSSLKNKEENTEEETENAEIEAEQDEEERIQTGIDIVAIPPGKKITSLGMLSGGERTLTSIALLFAIISHNPPPFAILDEVEAALDEANSRRFGKILNELSGKTQFVLITHNRETMRQAAVLYGVTMNDEGISQLLSVQLEQVGSKGEIKE